MDFKVILFDLLIITSLVTSLEMPNIEFIEKFAETNNRKNLVFHFSKEFSEEVIQWHKSQYKRFAISLQTHSINNLHIFIHSNRFDNPTYCYQPMSLDKSSFGNENSVISFNDKGLNIFIPDGKNLPDSTKVFSKFFSTRT